MPLAGFSVFRFFFFKQKTAYEMRISDWSSDVCSSDLPQGLGQRFEQIFERGAFTQRDHHLGGHAGAQAVVAAQRRDLLHFGRRYHHLDLEIFKARPGILETVRRYLADLAHQERQAAFLDTRKAHRRFQPARSEEHTSELQSLM